MLALSCLGEFINKLTADPNPWVDPLGLILGSSGRVASASTPGRLDFEIFFLSPLILFLLPTGILYPEVPGHVKMYCGTSSASSRSRCLRHVTLDEEERCSPIWTH